MNIFLYIVLVVTITLSQNIQTTHDNNIIPLYLDDTQGDLVGYIEAGPQDAATRSCSTSSPSYSLILPTAAGQTGQVLGLLDSAGHLTWLTTVTVANGVTEPNAVT